MTTRTYYATITKENGTYVGVVPQFGVSTFDKKKESMLEKLTDNLQLFIDTLKDHKIPIPKYPMELEKGIPLEVQV